MFHSSDLPESLADKALLARIVEIAEDAVIATNAKQEIVLFNRGAEKTFGYTAAEILGQPLDVLLPERFRASHREHVEAFGRGAVTARRMGERSEVLGRRKDGREFPADASISRFERDGAIVYTAVLRDISGRKAIEDEIRRLNQDLEQRVLVRTRELEAKSDELRDMTQQLWQAAKLASVGEVAAGIAHELNNPLATISLRLESVLTKTPVDDPRRKPLEIVEQEVRRMSELVANLLNFSRRGSHHASTVDPREELTRSLELVHYMLIKRSVRVRQLFAERTPPLVADRQKLRQLFLNLLTNAIDAMPWGGELTLSIEPAKLAGERAVAIEVRDTGVGIAADDLPHVTEPFFTTKEEGKGTGLGLPICKRIVQEHQGTFEITSELGHGTKVRVMLPVG